ncbi:hypothetical protein [Pandoraea sputorum]|uniref:Uncharacterized protein n=1 Tax=Pandoraea sputorum TaxID=93222 RepID=A0A5E5B8G1_9BURK|nr:hypothetical protein [Pandoraea sputorum]VVE81528.1 hypothetical protein PSP31121_03284 [Pandoraea sputorum]
MPRRTATLSPMFLSAASPATHPASTIVGTAESGDAPSSVRSIPPLLRVAAASLLLGASGLAFAQTPVCFDSVGRALPPEQCSQAARNQAAAQEASSASAAPTKRDYCKSLADKIANTPDKPVYTRDQRVDSPAGNRVDIPTRTNPRKALKEQYMRECT